MSGWAFDEGDGDTPNQPDSSRERETTHEERLARVRAIMRRTEAALPETLDGLWLAYDKAVGEDSETWKAEWRRRIERAYRAALRERVADVRGSSAQPAYMLGAEDMRAAVLALLEDTPDVG